MLCCKRASESGEMVQAAPFEAGGAIVLEAPGKLGCRKLVGVSGAYRACSPLLHCRRER